MSSRVRTTVLLLMISHVTITGCGYVVVKLGLSEWDAAALAFWRFAAATCALSLIAVVGKRWPKIERRDWPRVIALALLAIPVNQLVYLIGMRYTVPSHASLIYGSTAAFALLISAAVGYEKLKAFKFAAIGLALGGLTIVMFDSGSTVLGRGYLKGDVLIFFAMLSWAGYTVVAKPIVAKYGAISLTVFCLLLGMIVSLPLLYPYAAAQDYSKITGIGIFAVFYTGVMLSAVAYSIWFGLVKLIDPSQVAILTAPQPIVAATVSSIVIGEVIGLPLLLGGALVVAGVVMMDFPAIVARRNARKLIVKQYGSQG